MTRLQVMHSVAHYAHARCWSYETVFNRGDAIRRGMRLLRRHQGRVRIMILQQPCGSGFPMIWQRGRRGRLGPLRGKASAE
jgi:hypothetical protein